MRWTDDIPAWEIDQVRGLMHIRHKFYAFLATQCYSRGVILEPSLLALDRLE